MKAIGHLLTGVGFIALLWADLAAIIHIFAEHGFGWGLLTTIIPIGWAVAPFIAGTWLVGGLGLLTLVFGAWLVDSSPLVADSPHHAD